MAYDHQFFKERLSQFLPHLEIDYDRMNPDYVTLTLSIIGSKRVLSTSKTFLQPTRPDDLTAAITTLGRMQLELACQIVEESRR